MNEYTGINKYTVIISIGIILYIYRNWSLGIIYL
jgi:hypothetical protein